MSDDRHPWNALEGWYDRPDWAKRVGGTEPPPFKLFDRIEKVDEEARFRRRVERVLDDVVSLGIIRPADLGGGIAGKRADLVIVDDVAGMDPDLARYYGVEPVKRYDSRPGRRIRKQGSKP